MSIAKFQLQPSKHPRMGVVSDPDSKDPVVEKHVPNSQEQHVPTIEELDARFEAHAREVFRKASIKRRQSTERILGKFHNDSMTSLRRILKEI